MQIPSERNDVPAVSNWEKMPPLNWGSNRGSTKPVWLWAFQLSSLGQRCLSSSGKCFCPDKCLPAWQGASRLQLHPLPWTPLPPGADDCQIPMVGLGRLPLNPELLIISWTLRTSEQPIGSWTHDSPTFQPHLYFMGFFFFLNWLCQTLRHPRGVTSGHAMQWKRVSPPVGGLTWGNALTLSELDLVSPDLIWGQLSYIALWNPPNLTLACLSTLAFITFLRVAFASDMPAFLPFPNHSNYVHSCLVHLHALLFSAWNVFPFRAHLASSYHSLCLRSRVLFLKLFLGFLGKVKDSLLYHLMVLFNLYPP